MVIKIVANLACSFIGTIAYAGGHVPGAQKILYRMWNYGIGGLDDI